MNQQEPSTETSGLGERRRRREAERAARLAAEKAGQAQPLTRRELRRRQLEEQARLEAIATGELPLVDEDGRPLGPEAAAQAAFSAGAVTTAQPRVAARPPAPEAADRVPDPARPDGGPAARTEEPVAAPSPRVPEPVTGPSARTPEPVTGPSARTPEPVTGPSSRTPEPAGRGTTVRAGAPAGSRRSMRERLQDAPPAAPAEAPGERTATTRRPVVRAPHTAKGVRSLDSTGALTGVQPVQAPAAPARPAPAAPEAPVTTDPAGWAAAAAFPAPRFPDVPDDSTIVIDAVPASAPRDRTASAGTTSTPASAASARSAATPGSSPAAPAAQGPVAWPAVDRPAAPVAPQAAATADARSPEPPAPEPGPGPVFAPVRREPTEAEKARSVASPARVPSAASGPEAVAAAALGVDGEPDQDDYQEARPQWASLAEFSAATSESPEEPGEGVSRREPARRSVRDRMSGTADTAGATSARSAEDAEEETGYVDDMHTRNPAASLVKIVALVLAAVVIGLLIGLLAFNQGDDGASVRIQSLAGSAAAAVGQNP